MICIFSCLVLFVCYVISNKCKFIRFFTVLLSLSDFRYFKTFSRHHNFHKVNKNKIHSPCLQIAELLCDDLAEVMAQSIWNRKSKIITQRTKMHLRRHGKQKRHPSFCQQNFNSWENRLFFHFF